MTNIYTSAENTTSSTAFEVSPNADYQQYLTSNQERFTELVSGHKNLFRVNASKLADKYLENMPEEVRQHYNCQTCRSFIKRYGNLVVINDDGTHTSPFWNVDLALPEHKTAVAALAKEVERSPVNGILYAELPKLGIGHCGDHYHLFAMLPPQHVSVHDTDTQHQRQSKKMRSVQDVRNAILPNKVCKPFKADVLTSAITSFQAGNIAGKDKFLDPLVWLRDLQKQLTGIKNRNHQTAILMKAVAAAPEGFCHPRKAVTATLLKDIEEGEASIDTAVKRFESKIAGAVYRRPVAPPKDGVIDRANVLFEKLGLQPSMRRRFAKAEEIDAIWRTPVIEETPATKNGGFFDHLRQTPKVETPQEVTAKGVMTLNKFMRDILPTALEVFIYTPDTPQAFSGILTAAVPDAPPILKWDKPEKRNPFSGYAYVRGARPAQFSLAAGTFHKVFAISKNVEYWFGAGDAARDTNARIFFIEGAKDISDDTACLFPATIRSELHEVSSVIEAASNRGKREGQEEASAFGLGFPVGEYDIVGARRIKVKTETSTIIYTIDRNEE